MKLLLIRPSIGELGRGTKIEQGRMQPLALAVLAGMTPAPWHVELMDERHEALRYDTKPDLVAMTVETHHARRAYSISAEFRSRGIPVILGGMHPTLVPQEAAQYCDSLVTGDAETVWLTLLSDFQNGKLSSHYRGIAGCIQNSCFPDRSLLAHKGYLPASLIQFGRGCSHKCSYCASGVYFNKSHSVRNPEVVIDEIKYFKLKTLLFTDDNFIADREATLELCRRMKGLGLHWAAQVTVALFKDEVLIKAMKQAGCIGVLTGFESLDLQNLKEMQKFHNLVDYCNYADIVNGMKKAGLMSMAAFCVGHDHDTTSLIEDLTRFAIESQFSLASFQILTPYPGTELYSRLEQQGRLLYNGKWWMDPEYHYGKASFVPKSMSPEAKKIVYGLTAHLNYGAGILLDNFDKVPVFGLPYNHPWYSSYFNECEEIRMMSHSFPVDYFLNYLKKYKIKDTGIQLRFMEKKHLKRDCEIYTMLNNLCFKDHPFWSDRRPEEDLELFAPFSLFLDNENLIFAHTAEGRPIGFLLWYPDFNQLVNKPDKGFSLTELLNFRLRNPIRTFRFTEIAVDPEFLHLPVSLMMIQKLGEVIGTKPYLSGEGGFIFQSNTPSLNLVTRFLDRVAVKESVKRTYALYERNL